MGGPGGTQRRTRQPEGHGGGPGRRARWIGGPGVTRRAIGWEGTRGVLPVELKEPQLGVAPFGCEARVSRSVVPVGTAVGCCPVGWEGCCARGMGGGHSRTLRLLEHRARLMRGGHGGPGCRTRLLGGGGVFVLGVAPV